MKQIIYLVLFSAILLGACKKQANVNRNAIGHYLQQQLSDADFQAIDFSNTVQGRYNNCHWMRLSIKGEPGSQHFYLLQIDSAGSVIRGSRIALTVSVNKEQKVDGDIDINYLDNHQSMHSTIKNGFIELLHPDLLNKGTRDQSMIDPYKSLPEVIVYGRRPEQTSGLVFGIYFGLTALLQGNGSGYAPGSIAYPDPALYMHVDINGGGTPSPVNNTGNNASLPPNILLNLEPSPSLPGINLPAWLKCFTDIPDAGATCSITICGDLPVDDDPNANINFYTGATGHCFMEIKKTNGNQSVQQVIGFTAENAMTAVVNPEAFLPGKLVNNQNHKYNASITMPLSPQDFNTALAQLQSLSTTPYSIIHFDCLDFDLSVINSVRPLNPLQLPKNYYSGNTWELVSTGQRFYQLLSDMKAGGDPEAPNIFVGPPLFIGQSHGPCN